MIAWGIYILYPPGSGTTAFADLLLPQWCQPGDSSDNGVLLNILLFLIVLPSVIYSICTSYAIASFACRGRCKSSQLEYNVLSGSQQTNSAPLYSILLISIATTRHILSMRALSLSLSFTAVLSLASTVTSAALLPRSPVCANDGKTKPGEYVFQRALNQATNPSR